MVDTRFRIFPIAFLTIQLSLVYDAGVVASGLFVNRRFCAL